MVYRKKFAAEMDALYDNVIELARECHRRLQGCSEVLTDDSTEPARALVTGDKAVNRMEFDINTQVVNLITTQQPVATDLRLIISSIKISDDLERISDNISNIGEVRKRVRITNEKLILRLSTMEKLASLMLEDVYTAYEEKNTELCMEIIARDKDIDSLFVQITTSDIIEESDVFVTGQSQLSAKYLERIGDHVKNIAEHVYFIITGEKYEKIKRDEL